MGQGDAECFGDDLRRGGRAQKLAAATGAGTSPAAELCGLGKGELAVSKASAN